MADPSSIADPIPPNPNQLSSEFNSLPIPPLDPTIFSDEGFTDLGIFNDDVENFDFTFDDLYLPSENEDFLDTFGDGYEFRGSDLVQMYPEADGGSGSSLPENGDSDQSSIGGKVLNHPSPTTLCQVSGDQSSDVDRFLNVPSPESGNKCSLESENHHNEEVSEPASSQGSGNCDSAVSEALNYPSPDSGNCSKSVVSSPNFSDNSMNGDVDHKIKLEDSSKNSVLKLKRKKGNEDVNSESRMSKYHRSNDIDSGTNDEEDKKKARLMRNRESAQLSRQRKKHYVEELEDKVRSMHSTIQDLNTKISYMMAENASLRQQMSGNPMCPPPPGMYPHPPMAPMGYPWMPCPPYVMKPQGSQVPLVPIPRLKPQQPVSAPKAKKVESKKAEGKSKKVASVSFLGLLLFILLFGGIVPMVNVNYGGMREALPGGSKYFGNRVIYDHHHERVLMADKGHRNGTDLNLGIGSSNGKFTDTIHCERGHGHPRDSDEFVHSGNGSEPLVASLYVPRNDKLVKIDGNLIIHSVLASEKAMASREMKNGGETSLAVAPAIPVSARRHPHLYRRATIEQQRALAASGAADRDNLKSKSAAADGKLQQWFRDGLAGPLLHSGMCTEVFHFDISPASAGAIIPATSVGNISSEDRQNSTYINRGKNRRFLHGLPIPLPGSVNITKEHVGNNSERENFHGNNSLSSSASSMVVSVLVDPREAGDADVDGVMGSKSLSRIFVVVLLDSVKYVTYSCMLPAIKGSVFI